MVPCRGLRFNRGALLLWRRLGALCLLTALLPLPCSFAADETAPANLPPAPPLPAAPADGVLPGPVAAPPPNAVPPPAPPAVAAPAIIVGPGAIVPLQRVPNGAFNLLLEEEPIPEPPPRYNLNAEPEEAERDRVENLRVAEWLTTRWRAELTQRFGRDEPHKRLEAALSLLEYGRRQPDACIPQISVLEQLLKTRWERRPRESIRQMLARVASAPPESRGHDPDEDPFFSDRGEEEDLRERYEQTGAGPWPFRWRDDEAYWFARLEELVEAQLSDDAAAYFAARIDQDVKLSEWRRSAYVAAQIVARDQPQPALLAPWLARQEQPTLRQVAILAELLNSQLDERPDNPLRTTLRDRFLEELRRLPLGDGRLPEPVLSFVVRLYHQEAPEWNQVEQWLLELPQPRPYAFVAQTIGLDSEQWRRALLARRVAVQWQAKPLNEALGDLQRRVLFPIWIDDDAEVDRRTIKLSGAGPWLEMLDQLLAETPYRAHFLHGDLLWIGPAEKLAAARRRWEGVRGRLGQLGDYNAGFALLDPTDSESAVEWEWRETPLIEALTTVSGQLDIPFYCLAEGVLEKKRITWTPQLLPPSLVIAELIRRGGLEWDVYGRCLFLGTPEQLQQVADLRQRHERLLVQLNRRQDRVARTLLEVWGSNFLSDGPEPIALEDLPIFIQQSHEWGCGFAAPADAPLPKTASLETSLKPPHGDSLAWDLTILGRQLNLQWNSDEHGVYLAPAASMTAFGAAIARPRPPRGDDQRRLLAATATLEGGTKPLSEWTEELAAQCEIEFDFAALPKNSQERKISVSIAELPLERTLDLLSAAAGLRWELVGEKTIRLAPPEER